MIFCPLSHHMIRESCLSPGCLFWTEENAFCPLSHLTIWLGSHAYHPDAFLGLRKMHFVHYHISPYGWGVMLITRMLFWD